MALCCALIDELIEALIHTNNIYVADDAEASTTPSSHQVDCVSSQDHWDRYISAPRAGSAGKRRKHDVAPLTARGKTAAAGGGGSMAGKKSRRDEESQYQDEFSDAAESNNDDDDDSSSSSKDEEDESGY